MRSVPIGVTMVLVAALALSACGRRGALEPPPQAGPAPVADEAAVPSDPFVTVPAPGARAPVAPAPAVPDRPFILDAIL